MTEKSITFRVDQKIKFEYEKIAKERDLTPSQLLRAHMREFIELNKKKGGK